MKPSGRARILCVDDNIQVLESLSLHLGRKFDVCTAPGGAEGLREIEENGPFSVVVSDMRMPGMDGAEFLTHAREIAPETVRLVLTGQADIDSAIAAVNDGEVFRFLTKPCPPDELFKALESALEQHRLVTIEKVLLEQTLHGSIKALTDILALISPIAFGCATRVKQCVSSLANRLEIEDQWQVEVAAMLSQIGAVALPPATIERLYGGQELNEEERGMVERLPEVARQLIGHISRLEPVLEILDCLSGNRPTDGAESAVTDPLSFEIMRVAVAFDGLETQGCSRELAVATLRGEEGQYDERVLEAMGELVGAAEAARQVKTVPLGSVRVGMTFAQDVRMKNGALLVGRGCEVTASFLERLRNSQHEITCESIRVIVGEWQ